MVNQMMNRIDEQNDESNEEEGKKNKTTEICVKIVKMHKIKKGDIFFNKHKVVVILKETLEKMVQK